MRFVKIMLLWAFGLFNAAFHLVHFASVIQGKDSNREKLLVQAL